MITQKEQAALACMFPLGVPAVHYLEEVLRFEVSYSRDVYYSLCSFAYDHKWEIRTWRACNLNEPTGRWTMIMSRRSEVIEFEVREGRPINGYQPMPGPINYVHPPTKP